MAQRMGRNGVRISENGKGHSAKGASKALKIAREGIRSGQDFLALHAALIADVLERKVTTHQGNVVCSSGRNILHAIKLQMKYKKGSADLLRLSR